MEEKLNELNFEELNVEELSGSGDPVGTNNQPSSGHDRQDIDISDIEDEKPHRKDPTEAELKEYFQLVNEKVKQININKGAKEFKFDDGFICVARDQENANRKHENSLKK